MAKYLGLITSDIRGKIGGMVFSRSRGGSTLKAKTTPRHPGSVGQMMQQSTMSNANAAWKIMSAADRTTWAVQAAATIWSNSLGGTYSPTAQQLWCQAYSNAALLATVPPSTFPATFTPAQPIAFAGVTSSGSDLQLTVYPTSGAYTGNVLFFASHIVPPTVGYFKTLPRRFMNESASGGTANIANAYKNAYGAMPQPGSYLPIRAIPFVGSAFISGTPFLALLNVIS